LAAIMSEEREESLRGGRPEGVGGWKDLASSTLLVGGVLAILIAGFVLKSERPADAASVTSPAGPASPPAEVLLGTTITPETAPIDAAPPLTPPPPSSLSPAVPSAASMTTDPIVERLATRAASDIARLEAISEPWTAQLLVACRAETVDRVLAASKGAAKLYILPAEVRGDACFRICWGAYKTAKDAAAARDLPKGLRGKDKIAAVAIAKVIR
jgi:hypothetical protein